jgi:hypothetical protein
MKFFSVIFPRANAGEPEQKLHDTLPDAVTWLSKRSGQAADSNRIKDAAKQGGVYLGVKWELPARSASRRATAATQDAAPVPAVAVGTEEDREEEERSNAADGDDDESGDMPPQAVVVSTETKLRGLRCTLENLMFQGPMRTTPDGHIHIHDFINVVNGGVGSLPENVWHRLKKKTVIAEMQERILYIPNLRGGPPAPFTDTNTLINILAEMDGPRAKAFRREAAPVLHAFLRGDPAVAIVAEENRRFLEEEVPADSAFAQLLRDESNGLWIGSKSPVLNLRLTSPRHAENDDILAFHGQYCVYLIHFWVNLKGIRVCFIKFGWTKDCKERFRTHLNQLPRVGLKDSVPDDEATAAGNVEVYTMIPTGTKEATELLENYIRDSFAKHRVNGLYYASRKSELTEVLNGPEMLDIAAVEAKALAYIKKVEKDAEKKQAEKELLDDRKFQLQLEDRRLRMKELELEMLRARA